MIKKILAKKVILIIIAVLIVGGYTSYKIFLSDGEEELSLEKVVYGTVVREISETGAVKVSEERNLSFKYSGRIDNIYVKVGDQVEQGQKLAKLDTSQLYIELQEAQAALEVTQADYQKLLAGSSEQEIKVAETEVLNAQVALDNAEQTLEDVEIDAEEDLSQAYEDAVDTLDDAYLKISNALFKVDKIRRTYFTAGEQESIKVGDSSNAIENALNQAKTYIAQAKENYQHDKIDQAILKVKEALSDTKDALEVVRDMVETENYRDSVSNTDKDSLDDQKTYINTVTSNVIDSQQDISTTKITNETNINSAEADVSAAEVNLQKFQDQLALKKAGPTQENIDLYLAKIKQAQAKVSLLQNKIQESTLKSPSKGQVTKINKRDGETVQSSDSIISFFPSGPFQIEVDIYEEDIVEVKVGNPVLITLPAFPEQSLPGKVVSIDPAEKLIEGVVYYEVTIDFEETREGIKPGMTADIVIETAKKENILIIPRNAVKKIDSKRTVQVFEKGKVKEREIETGLEGNGFVEVVSGLTEGEDIVLD